MGLTRGNLLERSGVVVEEEILLTPVSGRRAEQLKLDVHRVVVVVVVAVRIDPILGDVA
jgi:hypothetical protein